MPEKNIRKFLKLIRRCKEVLTEVALWSSERQPQTHPRAVLLLWVEVDRCTCLATLAWSVAGLDEIPRKARTSFADARSLAFFSGLCWHLDSTHNCRPSMKRKAGRSCSHAPDRNADISSPVPLSALSALLSVTVRINPQGLWHSVCHTDQELKK